MTLLVLGGVLMVVLYPILGRREPWDLDAAPDRLRHLKRSRDRLLRTLKDVDNEQREGSLLEEDYKRLRSAYKEQAIRVTKELNRVRETVVRQISDGPGKPLTSDERRKLDSLVAKKKKKYR